MNTTITTIEDATRKWVGEFNAIPFGIVQKLYERDCEDVHEITPPALDNRVYYYGEIEDNDYGTIIEVVYNEDDDEIGYKIEFDNGKVLENVKSDDLEVIRDDVLPMWGTLWNFGDSADEWWLEQAGGLQAMADCGFRIYEQEDFGYLFGIDGAGYDFYEAHWIPLYKARGLQWHDTEE